MKKLRFHVTIQVHVTVSANRAFHPHANHHKQKKRKNEEYEKEITKLKEEIKTLKLSNRQKTATKNSFSSKQNTDSKNVNMSSTTSGDENEILHARHHDHFIKLQRAIKNTIRLQFDPAGQIINLTQKKYSRGIYKLFSKNLNFVPTQNKINKKELHDQLEEFYRRRKLKSHFQDIRKQADLSEEEYRFKSKNKHWVPKNTPHNRHIHRSNKKRR